MLDFPWPSAQQHIYLQENTATRLKRRAQIIIAWALIALVYGPRGTLSQLKPQRSDKSFWTSASNHSATSTIISAAQSVEVPSNSLVRAVLAHDETGHAPQIQKLQAQSFVGRFY